MAVYWVSFEIDYDTEASYGKRWTGLRNAVHSVGTTVWEETTSLYIVESNHTTKQMVAELSKPLDLSKDVLLIKKEGYRVARIVGAAKNTATLKSLLPYIR